MELPKTAMRIKNSKDYIDVDGAVYTYVSNCKGIPTDKLVKKAISLNKQCGYMYCNIYDNRVKKCVKKRVNRVVAETFIPNPDNLPIVGHRNNIKTDNRVENLYWTTYSENSQKAVDDGLLVNDKGYDDSQSKPVIMCDTLTNRVLGAYGSISEAALITGLSKSTIARQAKYHRPVRKPYYFRYADDETVTTNPLIGKFNYDTDALIGTYYSYSDAARRNNLPARTVSQQCNKGKPKHKFSDIYFKIITDMNCKCEQTIENR